MEIILLQDRIGNFLRKLYMCDVTNLPIRFLCRKGRFYRTPYKLQIPHQQHDNNLQWRGRIRNHHRIDSLRDYQQDERKTTGGVIPSWKTYKSRSRDGGGFSNVIFKWKEQLYTTYIRAENNQMCHSQWNFQVSIWPIGGEIGETLFWTFF